MAMATSSVDDDYASSRRSSRLVSSTDSVSMLPEPMSDPEESFSPDALFIISPNRGLGIDGKTRETGVHESESKREGFIDLNEARNNENEWRQIDLQKDGYLSGHSSSIDSLMSSGSPTHQQVATCRTTQDDVHQSRLNCNNDLHDERSTSIFDHNSWENETERRSPRQKYSNTEQCEGEGIICTECTTLPGYGKGSDYNQDPEDCPTRTESPHRDLDSPTCPTKHMTSKNVSPRKDVLTEHCKCVNEKRSELSFNQKASSFGEKSGSNVSPPRKEVRVISRGATRKRFIKQERISISPDFIDPVTDRNSTQDLRSPVITKPCCQMIDSLKSSPERVALRKQLPSLGGHLKEREEHCRVDSSANAGKLEIEKNLRQARQRLREGTSRVVVSASKSVASPSRKGNGTLSSGESSNQDVRTPCGGLSPAEGSAREGRGSSRKCEDCGKPHSTYDRYPYLHKYTGYLNCDVGTYEENNGHGSRGNRTFDSRLETPVASLLYRSRSLPRLSVHDSGVGSANEQNQGPGQPHNSKQLVADLKQLLTLKQHYYPEGGWGWVIVFVGVLVQILSHGTQGAAGVLFLQVAAKFGSQVHLGTGWLGAMSTGVALLVSPVTIAFCRRKSTRVTAVMGGLVTALGCLFTSFASQFHQLFFSYGTVVGIGVGMTRDCSTLMVAQYFKRRRELVEIFIVSGSGLGIAVMSAFIKGAISKIGWRLGLQAVTGVVFLTFILGTFYRSASLYHPQRRAILHLKNQKRKIKDKNKTDDRPPFFDFSTLRSKTVRILLVSTGISAFGINTPIFYLAHQAEEEGLGDTVILLQAYLGLAWTLGCVAFGLLVVHRNVECRIARQYLTQAAVFVCGLCILALTAVQGNYHGYVMFAWIYGIFCGGYHYSLKMYTYERVRARNFARTWGFVQCSQAIPIAIGVPISGYMNVGCGGKAGYYFSSTCVLVGSFTLFFIDLHKRNVLRHKHTRANGTKHLCVSDNCPQRRRLSFSQEPDNDGAHVAPAGTTSTALVLGADIPPPPGEIIDALGAEKPELTCISEEGIADMDLPDNLLEDLDYIGDCITSCNKVENYLMLSEFENNLIAEMPIIMDRRGRRWSLAKSKTGAAAAVTCGQQSAAGNGNGGNAPTSADEDEAKSKHQRANAPSNNRSITVIDEAST